MAEEMIYIDISDVPDLLRIAEEVRTTRTPRTLRRDNELDFVQFAVSNRQPVAAWLNQRVALNRDRGEKPLSEKSIRPRDADAR
jgi:hypothetical protein